MTTTNNKDAAVAFLEMATAGKVREAYTQFVGTGFRHHNPYFEGSAQALMEAMEENARANPDKVVDVKRVIAEGDYVVVHFHVRHHPDESGFAVMHIFRFDQGRIVELWDLGLEVPESSPNQYGVF